MRIFTLAMITGLLLSGCNSHKLVGRTWASVGGGVSSEMAFTDNHGFVRRYWTVGRAPEPFVGRYSADDGVLRFECRETVSGVAPKAEAPFSWEGEKLVLNEGAPQTFVPRADDADDTRELRGMWKREGEVPEGETSGLIFMPLHVEVMIGGTGRFEDNDGFEGDWQVCFYTCPDAVTLTETLDASNRGYHTYERSRSLRIEGDRLTLKAEGEPDQVYRRVEGEFPFSGKSFDKAAWDKLE